MNPGDSRPPDGLTKRTFPPSSCSWGYPWRRGAYSMENLCPVGALTLNRSPWKFVLLPTSRHRWCCSYGCRRQTAGSWSCSPKTVAVDFRKVTEGKEGRKEEMSHTLICVSFLFFSVDVHWFRKVGFAGICYGWVNSTILTLTVAPSVLLHF